MPNRDHNTRMYVCTQYPPNASVIMRILVTRRQADDTTIESAAERQMKENERATIILCMQSLHEAEVGVICIMIPSV